MKQEELFDALTGIDDKLILEAHETPVSRHGHHTGGLRRIAVLCAVVVFTILSVFAVAAVSSDPSFFAAVLSPSGKKTAGYESRSVEENHVIRVYGKDYPCLVYTTQSPDTALASIHLSTGETLEVVYEAEILLPGGTIHRKTISKQGNNRVVVYMTNTVDGVTGIILKTRVRFSRITANGVHQVISTWEDSLSEKYYENAPAGYTSDWPEDDLLPGETASAYAVIPENSDIAIIIQEHTN